MRLSDGVYKCSTAASVWSFSIPDDRTNVELIGVYSTDGRSMIQVDSYTIVEGVMTLYFGVDEHLGVVRYAYDTASSSTVIDGEGGTINLVVNQYNSPRS